MRRFFRVVFVLGFYGLSPTTAFSANVQIFSDDFETPAAGDYPGASINPDIGNFARNQLDGWQRNAVNEDPYGAYAPNLGFFSPAGQSHFSDTNKQVLFMSGSASIYKSIGTISENTDYEIELDIGNRLNLAASSASSVLFTANPNGKHLLSSNAGTVPISQFLSPIYTVESGQFSSRRFLVEAETIANEFGGASYEGQELFVGLLGRSSGQQVLFDNVSVTAISAVPIPASSMLFLSVLGTAALLRSKHKARSQIKRSEFMNRTAL